tara:strand:+ start:91 stop:336 length:246 start_codon:yes stop_codon:yes gene_type:complete
MLIVHTTEQTKHTYLIGQIDHNQIGYKRMTIMDLDRFNLMGKLKPYDRWVLECMYDGPIPIEVIKGKLQSYEGGYTNEDNN